MEVKINPRPRVWPLPSHQREIELNFKTLQNKLENIFGGTENVEKELREASGFNFEQDILKHFEDVAHPWMRDIVQRRKNFDDSTFWQIWIDKA